MFGPSAVDTGSLILAALLLVVFSGSLVAIMVLDVKVRPQREIRERLALVLPRSGDGAAAAEADVLKLEKRPLLPQRVLAMIAWAGGWEVVRIPLLVSSLVIVAVWAAADGVFLAGPFLSCVCALAIAGAVFFRLVQFVVQRRQTTFLDGLPAAIDLIVRAAQAGIPVVEAIGVAGKEIGPPVGSEFTAIAQMVQLGVDLKEALYEAADRVNLVDFDCFVVALVVQRETGGQLSETMRNLATIIRRRKETRGKARGMTAEGRLTAQVVGALPFVTGGFLTIVSPDYMRPLIDDSFGRQMLLVAIALVVGGFQLISHMTRSEPS